jgi:hypothetical protein
VQLLAIAAVGGGGRMQVHGAPGQALAERSRGCSLPNTKLSAETERVRVPPGQGVTPPPGSECCVAAGDRRGEAYTART